MPGLNVALSRLHTLQHRRVQDRTLLDYRHNEKCIREISDNMLLKTVLLLDTIDNFLYRVQSLNID